MLEILHFVLLVAKSAELAFDSPDLLLWLKPFLLQVAKAFGGAAAVLALRQGPPAALGIALLALRSGESHGRPAFRGVAGALAGSLAGGAAWLALDAEPILHSPPIRHLAALGWSLVFAATAAWMPEPWLRRCGPPLLAACCATTPLVEPGLGIIRLFRSFGSGVPVTAQMAAAVAAPFCMTLIFVLGAGLLLAFLLRRLRRPESGRWVIAALGLALEGLHGWALLLG